MFLKFDEEEILYNSTFICVYSSAHNSVYDSIYNPTYAAIYDSIYSVQGRNSDFVCLPSNVPIGLEDSAEC